MATRKIINEDSTKSNLDFKSFYVHYNHNRYRRDSCAIRSRPRGFTAKVSPSGKSRTINVQLTFCAYRDEFSKKEGRKTVETMPVQEINSRDLPEFLQRAEEKCHKFSYGFDYLLKYLV